MTTSRPISVLLPGCCILLGLILLGCQEAFAQLDGLSEIGHSYQSDARGGCETSIGDTALAHVRQPASVMLQKTSKFDSKITNIFILNNTWTNLFQRSRSEVNSAFAYNLGVVQKIRKKYAIGFAWETGGWNTRFYNRSLSGAFGRNIFNSVKYKTYSITANLGTRLGERWYVGAGPHFDVISLSTELPVGAGILRWPKSYSFGAGFQLGALFHPSKHWSLGASYSSPTYMAPLRNRRVTIQMPGGPVTTTPGRISSVTLPGRVNVGVAYLPSERIKVAVEGAYLNYGQSLLGSALVRLPGSTGNFAPGFKDFFVINTGMDYDFNEHFAGSVGYVFNTRPVSSNNLVPFYAANAQNQLTWGLRLKSKRLWTGFAHIVGMPASTRASTGAHAGLGPQYRGSNVRQLLQSFNFGVGFSW